MKLGKATLSGASVALVVIQLALVSSIAAKYLYQRWTSPRVWTRTVAYDPELLMRALPERAVGGEWLPEHAALGERGQDAA